MPYLPVFGFPNSLKMCRKHVWWAIFVVRGSNFRQNCGKIPSKCHIYLFSWIFMKFHEISRKSAPRGGYPPQKGVPGVEINEIGVSTVSPLGLAPISVDFQVFNEISLKSRGYPRETWNPSGNSHIKYSGAAEFPECTWTPPQPLFHIFDGVYHQRWGNPSSLAAFTAKDEENVGGAFFLSNS